jgi:hypothetical protein
MRGSHRGAADNGGLILLAVLAVIGLILYLIFAGTSLELWAVTWLVLMVTLVTVIRGRPKRDQAFYYWESAAALLTATWELVSGLAHHRGWAPGQLHFIAVIGQGTRVISLGCACVGIVVGIRSGSLRWRSSSAATEDDSPD